VAVLELVDCVEVAVEEAEVGFEFPDTGFHG